MAKIPATAALKPGRRSPPVRVSVGFKITPLRSAW
jgi:hypothetical protein